MGLEPSNQAPQDLPWPSRIATELTEIEAHAGRPFGKYQLLKRIALGGMAEVFLAHQAGAAGFVKPVVIKQILPSLSADPEFTGLFLDEGRLAAFLSHPNIAQTFDLGVVEGRYYLAMEYIQGETLDDICQRAWSRKIELPLGCAVRVMIQVLEALQYAHTLADEKGTSLGIIHRDVTPSNVIATYYGAVKLLDFGIARNTLRQHHTTVGYVRGKYGYMAPEQCFSGRIDHRVDIFAAGTLFYLMVTGQEPYPQEKDEDLFAAMTEAKYPTPSQMKPGLPGELEGIILKAMARDPVDRFASAREMLERLGRFAASLGMFPSAWELGDFVRELFPERALAELQQARARVQKAVTHALQTASPGEKPTPPRSDSDPSDSSNQFTDPAGRMTTPLSKARLLRWAERWKRLTPVEVAVAAAVVGLAIILAARAPMPKGTAALDAPQIVGEVKIEQAATETPTAVKAGSIPSVLPGPGSLPEPELSSPTGAKGQPSSRNRHPARKTPPP
jgi:eukaryotic-like serine/threonine-protein kinase